jgi:biotin-dependent carboxylase-like uncharacterized protein
MITLEVRRSGPLATVQDLGRPGLGHVGVTTSGAADRTSHTLANRLVANPDTHATIEITLGGLAVRVHGGDADISVTGADGTPEVDGKPFGINSVHRVRDGQEIVVNAARSGLRSYLAVRGGIAVDPVLGSRSYDTLSGIGPAPLRAGDLLPVGAAAPDFPRLAQAPVGRIPDGPVVLRAIPGPRADWFTDPDALVGTSWTVSQRSDRVGVRLTGEPLGRNRPGEELPSEGAVRGAIQVPPNGLPVILGPDHPVTGGYPVIGVVVDADTDSLAQVRPGQPVRLRWVGPHNASRGPRAW